jgi:dTDP-4-dehydrorhamnose reductase
LSKYLVLGSNGLLGHVVSLYLKEHGEDVTCLSKSYSSVTNNELIDLSNLTNLQEYLEENEFEWIINCAGVLNKSVDENLFEAITINSLLPHFLQRTLKGNKTRIVHISTDCVFDGKIGGYSEESIPSANDNYGITKRLGEIVSNSSLTIRTSIVGPEIGSNKKGLYDWFMKSKVKVNGYSSVFWSGVTTLQLAKFIHSLKMKEINGLINYVNNSKISKYDLLNLFKSTFQKDIEVINYPEYVVDKSLISIRDNDFKDIFPPSYSDMIAEMREWIVNHKDIYDYL